MTMFIHDLPHPEMPELQLHCHQCSSARGRLHGWYCMLESVVAFVAPRLITLALALGLLVLIGVSLPLRP